jgi:hypothetical protein
MIPLSRPALISSIIDRHATTMHRTHFTQPAFQNIPLMDAAHFGDITGDLSNGVLFGVLCGVLTVMVGIFGPVPASTLS